MQVNLKSLGLQAAQRILNAAANATGGHDAVGALQEVAQDFPRLVGQLSLQKYGKSLRLAGARPRPTHRWCPASFSPLPQLPPHAAAHLHCPLLLPVQWRGCSGTSLQGRNSSWSTG